MTKNRISVRLALAVFVICVLSPSILAADRTGILKPDEIADGWILLFDGETTFGWKIDGEAKVQDGTLVLGGNKATKAQTTTRFPWRAGNAYAFSMEVKWGGKQPPKVWAPKGWTTLDETAENKFLTIRWNNDGRTDKPEPVRPLAFEVPDGSLLFVRNVRFRPLGMTPLFNGKDLDGWKIFPNRKSVFSVTKKGELNIKNGPGDIQTVGQWDNFLLQLQIRTNGKHLNSGVFFRCLPGQFWAGYEAQIRNQWQGDDRTKPVDFGTGGIYRRQPARKVVANDNEWFTMTILADGNHLATWVNGYQVTDFVDTRPPNENARKGTKLGKGAISFQGHDPTTDLSFRNIRIVEWPKK
ncbi:MAG: glycosyl hydrolase [Gemmatales bacterium]|nr:MAG: glycosyl hydrolase [Gemmatales bacterium]